MSEAWYPLAWVPDRPPTRTEVALAVFFTVTWIPSQMLVAEAISLPAAAAGVVVTIALGGPIANSALGRRIGDWFCSIRTAWRALLLAVVAVPLFVAGAVVPHPIGIGYVLGTVFVFLAMLVAQLFRFRTVTERG